jgi:hypothetical protein
MGKRRVPVTLCNKAIALIDWLIEEEYVTAILCTLRLN